MKTNGGNLWTPVNYYVVEFHADYTGILPEWIKHEIRNYTNYPHNPYPPPSASFSATSLARPFQPLSQYQCIYNTHLRPPPHQSPPHPPHPNLYCFPNHPFQASSPHHLQYHDTLFSFSPFFKSCPPLSFPTYMDSDCCKKLHQFWRRVLLCDVATPWSSLIYIYCS